MNCLIVPVIPGITLKGNLIPAVMIVMIALEIELK